MGTDARSTFGGGLALWFDDEGMGWEDEGGGGLLVWGLVEGLEDIAVEEIWWTGLVRALRAAVFYSG